MKGILRICGILWSLFLLTAPVAAMEYTDEMIDLESNNIKTYSNLSHFSMEDNSWNTLPDRSVFGFAAKSSPRGWVNYRVQNAQHIRVGLYSNSGTFVSLAEEGVYALGVTTLDMSAYAGKTLAQASYSPGNNGVYGRVGAFFGRAHYNNAYYQLAACNPPGDLTGYGVNVLVSTDGQHFHKITLAHSKLQVSPRSPLVYEEYSGNIPAGSVQVRVELNDVTQFPLLDNPTKYEIKANKRYNLLASVTLSGDNLILGIPEPITPGPESSQQEETSSESSEASSSSESKKESSSKKSSSSGKSSGGSKASSGGGTSSTAAATKSSSSIPAVSKFEGVIVSSAGSGKTGSGKTSGSKSTGESTVKVEDSPSAEEETTQLEQPTQMSAYLEIPKKNDTDYFTVGITAYIIIVIAMLLFVLLATGSRKKK